LLFKIWTNLTEVASEKYWLVRALEAEQSPKKRIFWEALEGTLGQVIKNQYFYFRPLILRPLAVNLPSMLHFWRKLSYSCIVRVKKIPTPLCILVLELLEVCSKYSVHFISDEVYALSVYDNTITQFESVLNLLTQARS
jgi:hypothetical protein